MAADETSIALALIEGARDGVRRARRRARWNLFWSPLSGGSELVFVKWMLVAALLFGPGAALFFALELPIAIGGALTTAASVAAWAAWSRRAYDRLPPDREMLDMVDAELRGLNELLARRPQQHRLLEMVRVDSLDRELEELERSLSRDREQGYR